MSDSIEQEIAAAKARIAKAKESAAKRAEAKESPEAKLARLKIEARDAEAIEQAICEVGEIGKEIGVIRTDKGCIILKRPHVASMRKFQKKGDKVDVDDVLKLITPCRHYPDAETFNEYLEYWPALVGPCSEIVGRLGGVQAVEVEGK